MTPVTPDDLTALWASHCRYEFPAFGVDTATGLRDLPFAS